MLKIVRLTLVVTLVYLFTVAWLWHKTDQDSLSNRISELSPQAKQTRIFELERTQKQMQAGYQKSVLDNETFHSKHLPLAISYISANQQHNSYVWQDRAGNPFAYAALGVDKNHYFANSFLVGYEPYKTDKVWQPLVTLALKKTYQFDHKQHGPAWQDVWQNSQQAYFYSHGDCEDHAILLADWLISMGYDARVAIGKVPSGGHAWVILFYQGKEYLLEATNKRRPRSLSDFTLAKYAPDYQPYFMFNRSSFWVNIGSQLTTRYSGENWKITSTFIASTDLPDSTN